MDRKGYYRFASIGILFFCFIIIAIAFSIGDFIFFSHQVDIRDQEAGILVDRIVRGIVSDELVDLENVNIFEIAKLNPKVINNGDFYFKVSVFEDKK